MYGDSVVYIAITSIYVNLGRFLIPLSSLVSILSEDLELVAGILFQSILRQANFKGAKLLGASFFDADLTGISTVVLINCFFSSIPFLVVCFESPRISNISWIWLP